MEETSNRKVVQELNYNEETSTAMRKRSMINNEFLADVVFIVGPDKKRIFAHKLLLVMSSEYFYIMFNGNFAESQTREVVLKEDDPDLFLIILRYIYTDEVNLTLKNIRDIFNSAQKFRLTELIALVKEYMMKHIMEDEVLRILNENLYYGFPCVNTKCLEMISDNPLFYFKHEDFQNIDRPALEMILKLKQINCSDDTLQNALEIWGGCGKSNDKIKNLSKIIHEQERSYNCSKLRLFGQRPINGHERSADMIFTLVSKRPVSLYGLGMFITSPSSMVSVKLKIFDGENIVVANKYDIINKSVDVTHVANLFFEKVVLFPDHKYRISLKSSKSNDSFVCSEPIIYDKTIKFVFHTEKTYTICNGRHYIRPTVAFAHFLCKENIPTRNFDNIQVYKEFSSELPAILFRILFTPILQQFFYAIWE